MKENKDIILSALESINVSELSYTDWINVGMALKAEGLPVSVWDEWSAKDPSKYHTGECEKKWKSFNGEGMTGGTIVQMAKDRGWSFRKSGAMSWDDVIEFDDEPAPTGFSLSEEWNPSAELKTFIETLFDDDDIIGYVTNDAWMSEELGRPIFGKGVYNQTAKQILDGLKKHPEDIGWSVGDFKPDIGALIRINPLDGEGVKNENVVKFKYALVESDTIPIAEQEALFRKLELPIATLTYSGGKSLHAVVRVDASDFDEYKERVSFLYGFLKDNGVDIDTQNKNPSRLTRMPGVTRGENRQYLVATNIGRKSWVDWMDFAEGISDEFPEIESLQSLFKEPHPLPEPIIEGILRRGHKMLISGPSKAGKSFLLMGLSISIGFGLKWINQIECKQGKVLYVNLEIDQSSAINRFQEILRSMGLPVDDKRTANIELWTLRGKAVPLDKLAPRLIKRVQGQGFDVIIIDPIYKVITGDENNASEMGAFCNQFDKICAETGCSVIYCHHHSKGAQGMKKAMDRASGSGVFARDPDAQLDIIELEMSESERNRLVSDSETAWRMESSLREFKNIKPVNFWFDYPLHKVDESGELEKLYASGSMQGNLSKSSRRHPDRERKREEFEEAFDFLNMNGDWVRTKDLAEYMDVSVNTIKNRVHDYEDYGYYLDGFGYVKRQEERS